MLVTDAETKCVGDKFEILLTILAVFVINTLYFSKDNIGHQHPKDVTNIEILSVTCKNYHQHKVTNLHLSPIFMWPSKTGWFLIFMRCMKVDKFGFDLEIYFREFWLVDLIYYELFYRAKFLIENISHLSAYLMAL